jgi:uncharacterized membrane protein YhaH (DUF805 family)
MLSLFGISGRIGRGTWWMVQVGLLVIGLIFNYVFYPEIPATEAELEKFKTDPKLAMQFLSSLFVSLPISIILGILSTWLFITSSVQRLHDRNSSGWRILFWYVPLLVVCFAFYALFAFASWTMFIGGLLFALAGMLLAFVWVIIECGMLSGDDFENDFGAPPNAEARKLAFEKELRELRGEPEPAPASAFKPQIAAPQPAVSFAPSNARPSFGKR